MRFTITSPQKVLRPLLLAGMAAGLLMLGCEQGTQAAPTKLMPIDESCQNPELARTLRELTLVVGRKDKAALLSYLDPQIKCSFGGCAGVAGFSKYWKLDSNPAGSEVWQTLADMLVLGGAFDEGSTQSFAIPYVFARFPESHDAFEHLAITGANVQIRQAPKLASPVIAQLSYEIVPRIYNPKIVSETIAGQRYPWYQIRLADGKTGYVWGKYAYSPVGYRMALSNRSGKWKIDFMVAGD